MNRKLALIIALVGMGAIAACSREPAVTPPKATASGGHAHDDVGAHDDEHSHADSAKIPESSAGHGGPTVDLGSTTIGPFSVRASRDQGEVKPGGEAPIDVWLTGGDLSKVTAVRFWIGTESGTESVKARADIENPAEPNHWHTHAEVPNPMPEGSRLWVEIEVDGQTQVGSVALKAE